MNVCFSTIQAIIRQLKALWYLPLSSWDAGPLDGDRPGNGNRVYCTGPHPVCVLVKWTVYFDLVCTLSENLSGDGAANTQIKILKFLHSSLRKDGPATVTHKPEFNTRVSSTPWLALASAPYIAPKKSQRRSLALRMAAADEKTDPEVSACVYVNTLQTRGSSTRKKTWSHPRWLPINVFILLAHALTQTPTPASFVLCRFLTLALGHANANTNANSNLPHNTNLPEGNGQVSWVFHRARSKSNRQARLQVRGSQ